jgi:GxxExxY protein
MAELLYPEESYKIVGACFEVYNRMGCGFLEPVYHECLKIELDYQQIPYLSKPVQQLSYRDRILEQTYAPDFLCFDKILVEIKSVSQLIDEHRAKVMNYLHATNRELGLLVNFGQYPKLGYERFALTGAKRRR